MKLNTLYIILLSFVFYSKTTFAQEIRNFTAEGNLSWRPDPGENGVEGTIRYKIVLSSFFGEPTRKAMAEIDKASTIYYDGNTYTKEEVGVDVWEDIEFGVLDLAVDIYSGPNKVSTVEFDNVVSFDVAGSPDWDEIFPGLNEQQAKELYRRGFSLRNVRVVGLSNYNMYGLEKYIEQQESLRQHGAIMDEVDRAMVAGNYERAEDLLREASRLLPDDANTRLQLDEVQSIIEEENQARAQSEELIRQGDQALERGDIDEAKSLYDEAQGYTPESTVINNRLSNVNQQIAQREEEERVENLQSYREDRNEQMMLNKQEKDASAAALRSSLGSAGTLFGGVIADGISNNTDVNYYRGHSWHFSFNVGLDATLLPLATEYESKTYEYDGNYQTLIDSEEELEVMSPLGTGITGGLTFHPILSEYFGIGGFVQGTFGINPSLLLGSSDGSYATGTYSSSSELLTYSRLEFGGTVSLGFKAAKALFTYSRTINHFDYYKSESFEMDYLSSTRITDSSNDAAVNFSESRYGAGLRLTPYESGTTIDLMYFMVNPFNEGTLIQRNANLYQLNVWWQSRYKLGIEVAPEYGAVSNEYSYAELQDLQDWYVNLTFAYTMDFFGESYF